MSIAIEKLVNNIVSMIPLDLRDEKTGEVRSSGALLNRFSRICIDTSTTRNPNTGEYNVLHLTGITLYLPGSGGRKERKYKIGSNGSVSDRFWDTVRDHTKKKLWAKAREESAEKNIKNNGVNHTKLFIKKNEGWGGKRLLPPLC
jgi:hypothetical protein